MNKKTAIDYAEGTEGLMRFFTRLPANCELNDGCKFLNRTYLVVLLVEFWPINGRQVRKFDENRDFPTFKVIQTNHFWVKVSQFCVKFIDT